MPSYPEATAGRSGPDTGLSMVEDRVQSAHNKLDNIFSNIEAIENRLYAPRPTPIGASTSNDGAKDSNVENALNRLNSRLSRLEDQVARILHG